MRYLLCLALCLLAFGCGNGGTPTEPEKPEPPSRVRTKINAPAKLDPPDFERKTSLRMVRKSVEVQLGDNMDTALRAFTEEKNAYRISEMPPGWKDPAYTCQGWDAGALGFAAVLYDEKIVLALYHEDRAKEDRLQEILDVYERMNIDPARTLAGNRVRYWFWEKPDEKQRLMICVVTSPNTAEGLSISIALGYEEIMNIFGMSFAAAEKDKDAAERLFQEGLKTKRNQ
jgi:hypothetical protein